LTRLLRGSSNSRPLDEIIEVTKDLVDHGAKEVVLTGVSLGAYGVDLNLEDGLATLVYTLLSNTEVPRLRLSSIEPWDVSDNLISQWENPRLCRQLHIPLQSGSDTILRKMGRQITTDQYTGLVDKMRDQSPEIAITTDAMVGFPGERETDFNQTVSLVKAVQFSRLHVFPYSERKGTAAVKLPGKVPKQVRKLRANQLRILNQDLGTAFRKQMVGHSFPVLYQKQVQTDVWMGLTDTYVKVLTKSSLNLYNHIIETLIIGHRTGHILGQIQNG
jgi:threonylcarbamoyladenosine tRNA methylthiotransferase MtaB